MERARAQLWRVLLVISGVVAMVGGTMHPSAEVDGNVREDLAQMTANDSWVPGHTLVAIGTALLALGLWSAWRQRAWPAQVLRALLVAAVAFALYTVETIVHTVAHVDSDALRTGDSAPVAYSHLGLAALLYPVSGLALAYVSVQIWKAGRTAHRVIAVVGVAGGLVHAVSVPLTLLFQDRDVSPLFPVAAVMITIWSVSLGLIGFSSRRVPAPA